MVESSDASINTINGVSVIKIGKNIPQELIPIVAMHEAYHIVLKINQVTNGDFDELNKGNAIPYIKTKIQINSAIRNDFPELTDLVIKTIKWQFRIP
jgi:hypothetical protein